MFISTQELSHLRNLCLSFLWLNHLRVVWRRPCSGEGSVVSVETWIDCCRSERGCCPRRQTLPSSTHLLPLLQPSSVTPSASHLSEVASEQLGEEILGSRSRGEGAMWEHLQGGKEQVSVRDGVEESWRSRGPGSTWSGSLRTLNPWGAVE